MEYETFGKLALATCGVAILIVARWRHEQQLTSAPQFFVRSGPPRLREGGSRHTVRRVRPSFAQSLYWIGLTSSAALAGQAIATFLKRATM